jgi:NAD(P)H-dependent FMN reductase
MKKRVLAICGSTRQTSSNLFLMKAIREIFADTVDFRFYLSIAAIPHFNPDLDNDNPPSEVLAFRRLLRESDGVLICTPEYAMGVPGTLKNALDWTVSSCEFSHKPAALITASLSGEKSHASLMETLKVIESDITDGSNIVIPFIRTKVNDSGEITNEETKEQVKAVMNELISLMSEEKNQS